MRLTAAPTLWFDVETIYIDLWRYPAPMGYAAFGGHLHGFGFFKTSLTLRCGAFLSNKVDVLLPTFAIFVNSNENAKRASGLSGQRPTLSARRFPDSEDVAQKIFT